MRLDVRLDVRRALVLAALWWPASLAAQAKGARGPQLNIVIAPANALTEGPSISTDRLLSDAKTRQHLLSGFPAQIHYRLELWKKGGLFDDPAGRAEWDVYVSYDPTAQVYNVVRQTSDGQLREDFGGVGSVSSADAWLNRPFRPPLHPRSSGRYYYHLIVEVQTLTESDLDALQQWLRGPTAPGKTNNPVTVIGSGLGTLLSRVLGGASRKFDDRSGIFAVP